MVCREGGCTRSALRATAVAWLITAKVTVMFSAGAGELAEGVWEGRGFLGPYNVGRLLFECDSTLDSSTSDSGLPGRSLQVFKSSSLQVFKT